jgi:hypothetical protein
MRLIKLAENITSWDLDFTQLRGSREEREAQLLRALELEEEADAQEADAEATDS